MSWNSSSTTFFRGAEDFPNAAYRINTIRFVATNSPTFNL